MTSQIWLGFSVVGNELPYNLSREEVLIICHYQITTRCFDKPQTIWASGPGNRLSLPRFGRCNILSDLAFLDASTKKRCL